MVKQWPSYFAAASWKSGMKIYIPDTTPDIEGSQLA
jgi:hypothetical protein